jgi:hypothetical protein
LYSRNIGAAARRPIYASAFTAGFSSFPGIEPAVFDIPVRLPWFDFCDLSNQSYAISSFAFPNCCCGHPVVDFEHAAEALNVAVVESAKAVPLEKWIVFVHKLIGALLYDCMIGSLPLVVPY